MQESYLDKKDLSINNREVINLIIEAYNEAYRQPINIPNNYVSKIGVGVKD